MMTSETVDLNLDLPPLGLQSWPMSNSFELFTIMVLRTTFLWVLDGGITEPSNLAEEL